MKKRLIAVTAFALVLLSSCGGQSGLNDDTTSVGQFENSGIENREESETESSARSSFLESESELSEKTLDSEQTESTTESKTEQRKQTDAASKSSQENKQQAQTGQKQSAGKTPQTQKEQAASSKEPQTQKPEAAPEKPSASSKPSTVSRKQSIIYSASSGFSCFRIYTACKELWPECRTCIGQHSYRLLGRSHYSERELPVFKTGYTRPA